MTAKLSAWVGPIVPAMNLSRALALVAMGSAVFLSVDVLRLSADFRAFMPGPPQAKPGMTSFFGADPEGIVIGTGGHSAVRHTPYASIGSVADTRNRIVIFDQKGAVLADVSAHRQDPVLMNYIRKRVQESR